MTTTTTQRTFDNCPAVVWRGKFEVVIDRDLLPKRKNDGSSYQLAHTRYRWIVYTDGPHSRYQGEWNTYRSKRQAVEAAERTDTQFCMENAS